MATVVEEFIRLQPLKRVPTLVELQNLVAWLSDCQETCMLQQTDSLKQVLLPWLIDSTGQAFALGISISKKLPDFRPIWTFYRALEPEPEVEWAYASQDVALIHNMLLCFFPDETFSRQGAYAQPPKSMDIEVQEQAEAESEGTGEPEPFLQGSIEKLQLDCLMQSLASSRITGKLIITVPDRMGGIFFEDGFAVHSYLDGEEGHDAILELLTLRGGDFDVFADEPSPARTITRRMESLLMESAALMDYEHYLEKAGINESTVLEKIPMSYMEYLERMKEAPPLPEDLVLSVAANLDRPSSIEEIAARLGLTRAKWLPVIYGFVKFGVVRVSQRRETLRATHQQLLLSKASHIEDKGLLDVRTGLYTDSAFEFLLQLELTQAQAQNRRFSIILLSWPEKVNKLFESEALSNLLRSIELLSRPADLVCRYGSNGVGILLPDTGRAEAETMAGRMQERWDKGARAKGENEKPVPLKIGLGCHPEDGATTEDLVRAASQSGHSNMRTRG